MLVTIIIRTCIIYLFIINIAYTKHCRNISGITIYIIGI